MERKITITMDIIKGSIDFSHEGEPSNAEALAMLEYTKMMIFKDWMEEVSEN